MKAILSLLAASLAAAALAVPASAADRYIPGVTDFPNAPQGERYIAGVTDFPQTGGIEVYRPGVTDFPSYAPEPQAPVAVVDVHVTDGFDWLDAAFGAALGLAFGAMAAAALLVLRRRTDVSTA